MKVLSAVLWAGWKPHRLSFSFVSFISRHLFSRHLATQMLNISKFLKSIAGRTKRPRGPRGWDPCSTLCYSCQRNHECSFSFVKLSALGWKIFFQFHYLLGQLFVILVEHRPHDCSGKTFSRLCCHDYVFHVWCCQYRPQTYIERLSSCITYTEWWQGRVEVWWCPGQLLDYMPRY